jgi:hypothetical protein
MAIAALADILKNIGMEISGTVEDDSFVVVCNCKYII